MRISVERWTPPHRPSIIVVMVAVKTKRNLSQLRYLYLSIVARLASKVALIKSFLVPLRADTSIFPSLRLNNPNLSQLPSALIPKTLTADRQSLVCPYPSSLLQQPAEPTLQCCGYTANGSHIPERGQPAQPKSCRALAGTYINHLYITMASDMDRTPLVSHANPPAQTNVPREPLSLKLSEKARQEQTAINAAKQPMLSTSTPTPPGRPDPEKGTDPEKGPDGPPPPYSAFVPWRRRFILIVITVAGFFGPLAGGIYLPALPVLEQEFQASATAINITVSVFMLTFAFGVSNATP